MHKIKNNPTNKDDAVNKKYVDDNKVDKKNITTTIDSTSTDTQVPSAKAVYDKILDSKEVIVKSFVDENGGDFIECLNSLGLDADKIYSLGFNNLYTNLPYKAWWEVLITGCFTEKICIARNTWNDEYYIADLIKDGEWSIRRSWKKICTTSVADVPETVINVSTLSSDEAKEGEIIYIVKNGICHMTITNLKIKNTDQILKMFPDNTIPKCAIRERWYVLTDTTDATNNILVSIRQDGSMGHYKLGNIDKVYSGSFSYPVSES